MPRVNHVKKSQKDQGRCSKCGKELPKGSPYIWIKFRHGGKYKRCTDSQCAFRASDLTQSKMSGVYAAQECAQDDIATWDMAEADIDSLKEIAETCAESVREVAEEYRESASNKQEYFPDADDAAEWDEKADELESWADEIEGALGEYESGFEPAEPECPVCCGSMSYDGEGWDCDDEECGEHYEPLDNKDDQDRTRAEFGEAALGALESVVNECPV
jgi:hypothetical protein